MIRFLLNKIERILIRSFSLWCYMNAIKYKLNDIGFKIFDIVGLSSILKTIHKPYPEPIFFKVSPESDKL